MRLSITLGRDDDIDSSALDLVGQMISVMALVSEECLRVETVDEVVRQSDVIALSRRSDQADWQAQRLASGMDFGTQSAARPTQALGIRPPFSLRAPAAC